MYADRREVAPEAIGAADDRALVAGWAVPRESHGTPFLQSPTAAGNRHFGCLPWQRYHPLNGHANNRVSDRIACHPDRDHPDSGHPAGRRVRTVRRAAPVPAIRNTDRPVLLLTLRRTTPDDLWSVACPPPISSPNPGSVDFQTTGSACSYIGVCAHS